MKRIVSNLVAKKIKVAYESVDDQPGFLNRDHSYQDDIWNKSINTDGEEDVKKRFQKKKKKKFKRIIGL